ncbi:MAG: metallophosphoesterase [Bacteroidales bacterium]|nr:metallophosphoesterase [Candidatus Cacconaster caballi]
MKILCFFLTVFRFIVASPGEDASSQVGINWHCDSPGSLLELTCPTDTLFSEAILLTPVESPWKIEEHDPSVSGWEGYACRVPLSGLNPGCEYLYRVRLGDSVSEEGRFRTAPPEDCGEWKFIAFVDFQPAFNANTYPLLSAVDSLTGAQPLLSICSGDYTDYGCSEKEWEWALGHPFFRRHLHAGTPGDHEYWGHKMENGHIHMMQTPAGYNSLFCNPQNGIEQCLNSNYYFLYGNVLFVGLDTGDSNTTISEKYNAQAEWLKQVASKMKGKYKYLVAFGHKSVYGSNETDSGVSKYMRPLWVEAFREAGVNLFIGGHDHKYSRTENVDGTWYLDIGSSGRKYRVPEEAMYNDGIHKKVMNLKATDDCAAAIITVTKKSLNVEVRSAKGAVLDSFSL